MALSRLPSSPKYLVLRANRRRARVSRHHLPQTASILSNAYAFHPNGGAVGQVGGVDSSRHQQQCHNMPLATCAQSTHGNSIGACQGCPFNVQFCQVPNPRWALNKTNTRVRAFIYFCELQAKPQEEHTRPLETTQGTVHANSGSLELAEVTSVSKFIAKLVVGTSLPELRECRLWERYLHEGLLPKNNLALLSTNPRKQ